MKKVKNLESNMISTVTGGNILPGLESEVQNWEAPILSVLYRVDVTEPIITKKKKK